MAKEKNAEESSHGEMNDAGAKLKKKTKWKTRKASNTRTMRGKGKIAEETTK
jgi:hypothetical protein